VPITGPEQVAVRAAYGRNYDRLVFIKNKYGGPLVRGQADRLIEAGARPGPLAGRQIGQLGRYLHRMGAAPLEWSP
jgi:berberine-like enzyme